MSADTTERRHYALQGVHNLRDVGGYRAGESMSRWGKLFRSDALHQIDHEGRGRLAELGIAHIIDLRGSDERSHAPSLVDGLDIEVHHMPIFDDANPAVLAAGARGGLASVYDYIVDERGEQLVDAIRVIVGARDAEAVLVHCTAGKDRTGLVIAFALTAAGVEREEVVADYALSADYLRGEWAEAMLARMSEQGLPDSSETVELVTASPAVVLETLLARIDREFGSVGGYLQQHGLSAADRERLTVALVDERDGSQFSSDDIFRKES